MLTSSGVVMGAAFRNGRAMTVAAWAIAAAIMAINGTLLWELLIQELPSHWAARTGFLACVALYLGLVLYFAVGPQRCAMVCAAQKPFCAPQSAQTSWQTVTQQGLCYPTCYLHYHACITSWHVHADLVGTTAPKTQRML